MDGERAGAGATPGCCRGKEEWQWRTEASRAEAPEACGKGRVGWRFERTVLLGEE